MNLNSQKPEFELLKIFNSSGVGSYRLLSYFDSSGVGVVSLTPKLGVGGLTLRKIQ